MTDKHITVDSIRWHSALPWLHLLRIWSLAFRVRILAVSMLAVLVFSAGWRGISLLPFVEPDLSRDMLELMDPGGHSDLQRIAPIPGLKSDVEHRWLRPGMREEMPPWDGDLPRYNFPHRRLLWPSETVVRAARILFQRGNDWENVATGWTGLLWALLLWAIFGGAITRMASVRFARDESVGARASLKFSVSKWQSFCYAPLLPLLAVGVVTAVAYGTNLFDQWITGSSGSLLAMLGFVPILCGFCITWLLVLTVLTWPLMVVAISCEGSDGFDGLSRAFGYLLNRPAYATWLGGLAWLLCMGISWIAWWFIDAAIWLTDWSLGDVVSKTSAEIWVLTLDAFRLAILVSLFWSATTVIYFLLRQSDDGTPLDEVYIPGPPPKAEPLPLVGVAASQQPVIERPATEPVATVGSPVVSSDSGDAP